MTDILKTKLNFIQLMSSIKYVTLTLQINVTDGFGCIFNYYPTA